ncbi:MAG: hypothetical protein WBA57_18315 [Elainellaceae cyanobacterium]
MLLPIHILSDSTIKELGLLIAVLGLIITSVINREKFRFTKLKVEIVDKFVKVNYRKNQILDFQINLRLQAVNGKICLRETKLTFQRGLFKEQDLENFNAVAERIEGDLTKYSEEDFFEFMKCVVVECDCSKILENKSRFRQFIKLDNLILEQDTPISITLLGRILKYSPDKAYSLQLNYDLNGSNKRALKKLGFSKLIKKE